MRSAVKVIEANHVYKVFGRRPSDGVKKLKAGRTDVYKRQLEASPGLQLYSFTFG